MQRSRLRSSDGKGVCSYCFVITYFYFYFSRLNLTASASTLFFHFAKPLPRNARWNFTCNSKSCQKWGIFNVQYFQPQESAFPQSDWRINRHSVGRRADLERAPAIGPKWGAKLRINVGWGVSGHSFYPSFAYPQIKNNNNSVTEEQ